MKNEIVANFLDIVKNKYALFDGRARRKEFWYFYLVIIALYVVVMILMAILGAISATLAMIVYGIFAICMLGLLVPIIGLSIRRLHDVGKSGWFFLLGFVPLVNFYVIYLYVIEGTVGDNEYGADPKAGER